MLDVHSFMLELAEKRALFHSEADFQHAFAWQLQQHYPEAQIRLEYPFEVDKWIYIDIWAVIGDVRYAIELKYKTSRLQITHSDERYNLKNQGAQDLGRYDYLKDLQRLENIRSLVSNTVGLAIILTNDPGYWNEGRANTVDAAFRLHDRRIIAGQLNWHSDASQGTTKGRTDTLFFRQRYEIQWQRYSRIPETPRGEFRYCALEVAGH